MYVLVCVFQCVRSRFRIIVISIPHPSLCAHNPTPPQHPQPPSTPILSLKLSLSLSLKLSISLSFSLSLYPVPSTRVAAAHLCRNVWPTPNRKNGIFCLLQPPRSRIWPMQKSARSQPHQDGIGGAAGGALEAPQPPPKGRSAPWPGFRKRFLRTSRYHAPL